MIWIIILLVIVGVILIVFFNDRNSMLSRQVDIHGGMTSKYKILVDYLTEYPEANIYKVTRDHIHIRAMNESAITNYFITENFNEVVIEWVGQFRNSGTFKKRWSFHHTYDQEKIIEEIISYLDWKMKEIGVEKSIDFQKVVQAPKNREEKVFVVFALDNENNVEIKVKHFTDITSALYQFENYRTLIEQNDKNYSVFVLLLLDDNKFKILDYHNKGQSILSEIDNNPFDLFRIIRESNTKTTEKKSIEEYFKNF